MTQEKSVNENEEESELLDFNNPTFKFIPKGNHNWKQRGYHLVCISCDLEHGVFIGPDKMLIGIDDKGPILKSRKDLGMI